MASCKDCKNFEKALHPSEAHNYYGYCNWHDAITGKDVVELDCAERDCAGFEKR